MLSPNFVRTLAGAFTLTIALLVPSIAHAAGTVNGTVTADGGGALEGACVELASFHDGFRQTTTDANGDYSFPTVAPGQFRLEFRGCTAGSYESEYYNNKPVSSGSFDAITVPEGATVTINAGLAASSPRTEIQGRVVDETQQGMGLVCVNASASAGFASTQTNANGDYTLTGLRTGSYRINFTDCGSRGYVTEYYDDATNPNDADLVSVTGGDPPTTGIDAELAPGGEISGTVTNSDQNNVAMACVTAYPAGDPFQQPFSSSTDVNGAYTIRGMPTGDYKVSFGNCGSGPYTTEWWNDKPSRDTADPVTVTAGQTAVNTDAELARGGTMTGLITAPGGAPIQGACVNISSAQGPGGSFFSAGPTGPDGTYTIQGITPGSYKAEFRSCGPSSYLTEYFDNAANANDATPIEIEAEATDVVDVELAPGGAISGRVTDPNGNPVSGFCVAALQNRSFADRTATTNANGEYTISRLRDGSYEVGFAPCNASSPYVTQVYNGEDLLEDGDPVTVTAPDTTTGIDASLRLGATLSGHVENAQGAPLANICVTPQRVGVSEVVSRNTRTDASGNYSIPGLASADYRVSFFDCGPSQTYAGEYYNDSTFSDADPVTLTEPQTTSGIDAVLAASSRINGTLTAAGGAPAASACVNLYRANADGLFDYEKLVNGGLSNAQGDYSISNVAPGDYKLAFGDCGGAPFGGDGTSYANEAHADKQSLDAADVVSVTEGSTLDIDGELAVGGRIAGTVSDGTNPVGGVCIAAENQTNGAQISAITSDESGNYVLRGVPAGDWVVHFFTAGCKGAYASGYAGEYHDNASSRAGADPITVAANDRITGVDAAMSDDPDPDTIISSGPSATSNQTSASFAFGSNEPGASFECKLDVGAFAACSSPQTYSGLSETSHTFEVRAIDGIGQADPTPASRGWTVSTASQTQTTSGTAAAGEEVSTDPDNSGPSPSEPTTAAITTPHDAEVLITGAPASAAPTGFNFLGREFQITVTPNIGTPDAPLRFEFTLDSSAVAGGFNPPNAGGVDINSVQVLRDGAAAGPCAAQWHRRARPVRRVARARRRRPANRRPQLARKQVEHGCRDAAAGGQVHCAAAGRPKACRCEGEDRADEVQARHGQRLADKPDPEGLRALAKAAAVACAPGQHPDRPRSQRQTLSTSRRALATSCSGSIKGASA